MNISDLYNSYLQNKMTKHGYIQKAYKNQLKLFEFNQFLENSDIKEIRISENGILFTIASCIENKTIQMILDPSDSRFIPIEIFNFKKFEPDVAPFLYYIAKNSRNIFDIGANIGWYSLNFNLLQNVQAIHSFEAIPRTFNFLKTHLSINNATKIVANNVAVSNTLGEVEFYWTERETGSASMRNNQNRKKINKIICETITLDSYVESNNVPVDLIKCDVEGSELLVFEGGAHTIKQYTPVIFTEMLRKWSAKFDYHPNKIIDFMNNLNYDCFTVMNGIFTKVTSITESTVETNFFFMHTQNHSNMIRELTVGSNK